MLFFFLIFAKITFKKQNQMKNFILGLALVMSSMVFASFPVYTSQEGKVTTEKSQVSAKADSSITNVRTNASASVQKSDVSRTNESTSITPAAKGGYDKWIAVALWFFLGFVAAHRWYAGKPTGYNILYIITLGGLGIWAIIDLINILTDKF